MNANKKEEIRNSIETCKMRLRTIQPHLTDDKASLNETFNKLLIKKAILSDQLKRKETPFFSRLAQKVRVSSGRKEFICDYFK